MRAVSLRQRFRNEFCMFEAVRGGQGSCGDQEAEKEAEADEPRSGRHYNCAPPKCIRKPEDFTHRNDLIDLPTKNTKPEETEGNLFYQAISFSLNKSEEVCIWVYERGERERLRSPHKYLGNEI